MNKEQIKQALNELPSSICNEGKRSITKLVEAITGECFSEETLPEFQIGEIWGEKNPENHYISNLVILSTWKDPFQDSSKTYFCGGVGGKNTVNPFSNGLYTRKEMQEYLNHNDMKKIGQIKWELNK
jgi:hypothetical protein